MNLRRMFISERTRLATIDDYKFEFTIERCDYDRSVRYVLTATCEKADNDRYKTLRVDKVIQNFLDQEPSMVHHALLFQLKMYIKRNKISISK